MADNDVQLDISDFDSSDLDLDTDEETFFVAPENAGKRNVDAIFANQKQNRLDSKKAVRNLEFGSGAPKTFYMQNATKNMFNAFLKTLNHDPSRCPSGEIIERFIHTLIRTVKPRVGGRGIPSMNTIRLYWVTLVSYLEFEYQDFEKNYGRRQQARIKVLLSQEARKGNLVKGRTVARQWLGFVTLSKMVHAYLSAAAERGTRCWDSVVLRTVGVLLQSACASRNGDIARSDCYKGDEHLAWGDVELTLRPCEEPSIQDLRGKITLRFCKGEKDLVNDDHVVFVDPLPNDATSHHVCVIKLLVAHGLRQGQCFGTTVNQALSHAASRQDRKMIWQSPNMPVLAQINGSNGGLYPEQPASARQITESVKLMALAAGILAPVTARAIRNGAARDLAHSKMPHEGLGVANEQTAAMLNHTRTSLTSGVTQNYVGPPQLFGYNVRAVAAFDDRLAPVSVPPNLISPDDLDAADAEALATTQLESIISGDTDPTDNTPQLPTAIDATIFPIDPDSFVNFLARINVFRNFGHWNHNDPMENMKHVPTGNSREAPVAFWYHCPRGCEYSHYLPEKVREHDVNCKGPKQRSQIEQLVCHEEGCMATFTNKNSLAAHTHRKHNWQQRKCTAGCSEENSPVFNSFADYKKHLIELHDELEDETLCPLEAECSSAQLFTTRTSLRRHLRSLHGVTTEDMEIFVKSKVSTYQKKRDIFSSKCAIAGCKSTIVFETRSQLRDHLANAHKLSVDEARAHVPLSDQWKPRAMPTALEPRRCPAVDVCKSRQVFKGPATLRNHLISATLHRLSRPEADLLAERAFGKSARENKRRKIG